jgi:predicted GNAT family acetyltransferase
MDRERLIAALAQTWPVRAAKTGLAALQLPGDVYQGNVSMYGEDGRTNPEVIGRSADLAGMLMSGGVPMAETGALGMAGGKIGNPFDAVAAKYPQVKLDISPARSPNDYATLSRIQVPDEMRGQGLATKVMQDVVTEADKAGTNLALSPSGDWGASVARLKEFYQRFGFIPNAGRSKDFATRETMIRPPKKAD